MNKFNLRTAALVVTGLIAGATPLATAVAQTSGAPAAAQNTAPAPQRPQRAAQRLPGERIDAQLAYLKTAFKITPAQESAWAGLAAVMRRQAETRDAEIVKQRDARQAGQRPPARDAIARLQDRHEMLNGTAVRANELLLAAKPLYAMMSDDQKKNADELLVRGGDRGGFGGRQAGHFGRFR